MNAQASIIDGSFKRALENILTRVFVSQDVRLPNKLAVALSGGLDSSVMLALANDYAKAHGMTLYAFHVHHGVSANADAWRDHCQQACEIGDVRFSFAHVKIDANDPRGFEAAAREERYCALGRMCAKYQIPLLLTAHHQDDQAETLCLQLLRGSGLAGLSAMPDITQAANLLANPHVTLARPLLDISRRELEQYVREKNIAHIDDESNDDLSHPRNALRKAICPEIEKYFPEFQSRIARSAQHIQTAQHLLQELAEQDYAQCHVAEHLNITVLRHLSQARIDNLLRYWLGKHGLRMPATAWLEEARTQLLHAREDAQICLLHDGIEIRRFQKHIRIVRPTPPRKDAQAMQFQWREETYIDFPEFGGTLHFDLAEQGVDEQWLKAQSLTLAPYRGTGRLKLVENRPTRTLKEHFQELGVPAWERTHLPVVYVGKQLFYAPKIGCDCRVAASQKKRGGVVLRWGN